MAAEPTRKPFIFAITLLAALCQAACWEDPVRTSESLLRAGKPTKALRVTEIALARRSLKDTSYWGLVLLKAQILKGLDRQSALSWLQSLDPDRASPAELAARLVGEKATIENDLGQFAQANQDSIKALKLVGSRDARFVAILQVRRARALIGLREPEAAEQCLAKADAYAHFSNDGYLEPFILHDRGQALAARNRFEDAVGPLEAALMQFRQAKLNGSVSQATISLAWCYYRLGQTDKALSLYQEALASTGPEDRHLALGHLGNIAWEQRAFVKAAQYYREAASLAKGRDQSYYPRWLHNLAGALIERAEWSDAEQVNNEALELEKHIDGAPGLAMALVNEGRIETHKGNYEVAGPILRQVAESREGDPSFTLDAYSALAEMYARMGKPELVKRQFEAALTLADETNGKLHEDENKLSYLSSLIDLNRKYVDFLMDCGDKAGAFDIVESSRARLLRERLDLSRAKLHHYKIAQYQEAARASGATFLSYWIGPEHSYLWAIFGNRFASYRLPSEPEIRALVERYQRAVERDPSAKAEDVAAGAKLFRFLLPSDVLKQGSRYLIVPDGPLYALNFETLPVPGGRPYYWIEDATIAVAPSLDLLLANQVQPSPGRSLLLVGDANEWSPQYPKLLHAKKEMADIEQVFLSAGRKVLAEAAATPAAYLRSNPAQFAYIHFTAHATANKNSPFDSAIILSRETPSAPGKLSAKEVLSTRVRAELVTISACHSAGARTYWGEGLVGFAWAFLQSGAHAVIAGLWDVSDYSSPRLMRDLYAGLAASQTPANALRAAKLNLIRSGKYADPYYWGAFQLYQGALSAGQKLHAVEAGRNSEPRAQKVENVAAHAEGGAGHFSLNFREAFSSIGFPWPKQATWKSI